MKLICVNSLSNMNYAHYNIKIGEVYDAELMVELSSWNQKGFDVKFWKIYITNETPIYSYIDSGEFMELSEYRNKKLDKLGIDG